VRHVLVLCRCCVGGVISACVSQLRMRKCRVTSRSSCCPRLPTRTRALLPVLIAAHLNTSESIAQACAMCQTVMPRGADPMTQGLFWGVLILLVAPFLVVGSIGAWLYYHSRIIRRTSTTAPVRFPSTRNHTEDRQ